MLSGETGDSMEANQTLARARSNTGYSSRQNKAI